MDLAVEADRELLAALLRRHGEALPVDVWCAVSAAADELIDPLVAPTLVEVDETASADLAAVVAEVRGRLQHAAVSAPAVAEAMACARAARALGEAERALAGGRR